MIFMTARVGQRPPKNSIESLTSPSETETNNHIPAKLIAVGEKVFGKGVITQTVNWYK